MKTKRLLGLLLLILPITGFVACSDDEPQDKVETVKMLISDKTGTYQPWGSDSPIDCMLVKEESESDYKTLDFQGITDFVYEKGYEYALWVEKRTLVDPPADKLMMALFALLITGFVGLLFGMGFMGTVLPACGSFVLCFA